MHIYLYLFAFLALVCNCLGVPASPTDRLWEELRSAKGVITNIASQLDKFNSLYLTKLEQRMISLVSTMASIDSNVKNLQERAHVWDTFQLHVSAWNEQINTLDKKVEIISKGQEKMFMLDGKINAISNIDYKTERIVGKLDDNQATLQTIIRTIENQNHDPLYGEFTTRGVLSTLKTIERKLDKLQLQHASSQAILAKQITEKKQSDEDGQKGKLLIKCNTPPIVEELLNDVASKVDVMFDKFTGPEEQNDESNADDQDNSNGDLSQETKTDSDLKLIKGLLKRLNQPCKRTFKILENLEASIKVIDNTTFAIFEDGQSFHNDLITYSQSTDKKIQTASSKSEKLINKIEDYLTLVDRKLLSQQESLESYFSEQRSHFTGILQSELQKNCVDTSKSSYGISTDDTEIYEEHSVNVNNKIYSDITPLYSDKNNCEDLGPSETSGVYILGRGEYKNSAGRSSSIRYCEVNHDGGWTVIQRRGVNPLEQSFNYSWTYYKDGFGLLDKDFWFGNDFIHNLVYNRSVILRVELEDFEGNMAWAEYTTFVVAGEDEHYQLTIGGYRGNASDSFSAHNNSSFSTYDRTNDEAPPCCPCSPSYGGGWWFYSCFEANLNGIYYKEPNSNDYFRGLIWENWLGNYSLRKTKLLIRPNINTESESGSGSEPDTEDPFEIPEDP